MAQKPQGLACWLDTEAAPKCLLKPHLILSTNEPFQWEVSMCTSNTVLPPPRTVDEGNDEEEEGTNLSTCCYRLCYLSGHSTIPKHPLVCLLRVNSLLFVLFMTPLKILLVLLSYRCHCLKYAGWFYYYPPPHLYHSYHHSYSYHFYYNGIMTSNPSLNP